MNSPPKDPRKDPTEISDFFPAIELWADEDPDTLENLRSALLSDLTPATPYQRALANNLVELEWDRLRHRRMRDSLLKSKTKALAAQYLSGEYDFLGPNPNSEEQKTAIALVGLDPKLRQAAEEHMVKCGTSTTELLSQAYQQLAKDMDHHERQIADLEGRRRRLRQDYDQLRLRPQPHVQDAEVLDET